MLTKPQHGNSTAQSQAVLSLPLAAARRCIHSSMHSVGPRVYQYSKNDFITEMTPADCTRGLCRPDMHTVHGCRSGKAAPPLVLVAAENAALSMSRRQPTARRQRTSFQHAGVPVAVGRRKGKALNLGITLPGVATLLYRSHALPWH